LVGEWWRAGVEGSRDGDRLGINKSGVNNGAFFGYYVIMGCTTISRGVLITYHIPCTAFFLSITA